MDRKGLRLSLRKNKARLKRARRRLTHTRRYIQKVRATVIKRSKQLEKLEEGPQAAVRWSLAQIGTVEKPPYSNSGPKISQWIKASGGQPGEPWCQYFVNQALREAGGPDLKSGYTPAVVQWAKEGEHGLSIVEKSSRRPGDLVYYKFPGVSTAICDHVGICVGKSRYVEGNTSPGSAGSQNNGGGVFLRGADRDKFIIAVVRWS